ncbi:MAG: hypothetical protein IKK57_08030 [Clostridia bacterium]|nr:hypothetical protein [Clostridia bacterium]
MSRKKRRSAAQHRTIILLAWCHRYVFLIAAPLLPLLLARSKSDALAGMGVGMLCYGLYTLLGYLLRWKHIYCSFQSIAHVPMTPGNIRWHTIRKGDVYGVSAIFIVMGLAMILYRVVGL